jgi:steroid 5-alpha reductase family enzyme
MYVRVFDDTDLTLQRKFIAHGLWRYVRHPNYTCEMVMWMALWLTASNAFVDRSVGARTRTAEVHRYEYLTIACPLLEACLIIFVSGVPLLEAHARKTWAGDANYQAYVRRTHRLLPYVW